MRYYDLKKNWRKVKRHIGKPEVQEVLVQDFNKFTFGRWHKEFKPGQVPTEFESCDWQGTARECGLKGRTPAFWQYTKHYACHWLVNFNLCLAQLVEPDRPWRILESKGHSTVWDGDELLFDFNFQAMGIEPKECFKLARRRGRELKPGAFIRVYLADHYSPDRNAKRALLLMATEDVQNPGLAKITKTETGKFEVTWADAV